MEYKRKRPYNYVFINDEEALVIQADQEWIIWSEADILDFMKAVEAGEEPAHFPFILAPDVRNPGWVISDAALVSTIEEYFSYDKDSE